MKSKRDKHRNQKPQPDRDLLDIEPELRQLGGRLMILTLLGEAQDNVEPSAPASLARSAQQAFAAIDDTWRKLVNMET